MLGRTVAWVRFGDLRVAALRAGVPDLSEYDAGMEDDQKHGTKRLLILQVNNGQVHLPATHRKKITDLMRRLGVRQAVITDQALSRGMITAMSWLGSDVKAYAWKDLDRAVEHLGLPSGCTRDELYAAIERLRAHLLAEAERAAEA